MIRPSFCTIGFLFLAFGALVHGAAAFSFEPEAAPAAEIPGSQRAMARNEIVIDESSSTFDIQLPSGEILSFENAHVRVNGGVRTIQARRGDAQLLITSDGVNAFGYVTDASSHYRITTVNRVVQIADAATQPHPQQAIKGRIDDAVINYELIQQYLLEGRFEDLAALSSLAPTVVDIAFFYDQALADSTSTQYPRTVAQASVDYTNAAIAAHNVELQLRLVYVGPLSTPLNGQDPFNTFASNSDKWVTASEYGADLVHYIYSYGGEPYCGKAYLPGRTGVSAAECGNSTISHEIGHNFGLHHDRANASNTGLPYSGYNYGYVCGNAGTIMAYYSPNVPHYSSPLLSNNEEACGIDIGQPNAAFNGAVLDVTRDSTAAYEESQTTIGTVSLTTTGSIQVDEVDAPSIVIDIVRDGDLSQEASVEVGAIEASATAGSDFEDFVERIVFAPGESAKQVTFGIYDDEEYEPDPETLEVVVRYPYKLQVVGGSLVVEITSDDPDRGTAQFATGAYAAVWESQADVPVPVLRVGTTTETLTVNFETVAGSSQPGIDYVASGGQVTFGVGETQKTVNIQIIDDDLFEGYTATEFYVDLSGANVSQNNRRFPIYVWNDDLYVGQVRFESDTYLVREDGGGFYIRILRENGAEGPHYFCFNDSGSGNAVSGVDYGPVNTCPTLQNQVVETQIYVPIYDDADPDGEKTIDLDLASSYGLGTPSMASVVIIDNDAPTSGGGAVDFLSDNYATDENAGLVEIAVQRSGGSAGAAAVNYTTVAGTAAPGADYLQRSGTLYWNDGDESARNITVQLLDDPFVEPVETFDVVLSDPAGVTLGSVTTATVSINSEDISGTLTLVEAARSMPEAGYIDIYVYRQLGYNGAISVSYETQAGSADAGLDFVPVSGVLNWGDGESSYKVVRVFGINDDHYEPDEIFTFRIFDPVGSPELDVAETVVTMINDDVPELQTHILALPDVNSGGSPDLAVAVPGSLQVQVRDGSTGELIGNIDFGSEAAFDMALVPDLNASGSPEIAVLNMRDNGVSRVQARDILSHELTGNAFFGSQYQPIELDIVPDYDGNGLAEVAVLGQEIGTDRVRVQVRDLATNAGIRSVFLGNRMLVENLCVLPDASGNLMPEIAAMGVVKTSNQIMAPVVDASDAVLHQTVFWANQFAPVKTLALDDISGGGAPELVALGRDPVSGAGRLQVRDASTRAPIMTAFLGSASEAIDMVLIPDTNTNGFPDIAVLSRQGAGTALVRVYDSDTGDLLKNVFYNTLQNPLGLAALADYSNNAADELAVLGENAGIRQVQIKDSLTGTLVNSIDFP